LDFTHKKIIDIFISQGERVYNELFTLKASVNSTHKNVGDFVALIEKYNFALSSKERLSKMHSYLIHLKIIIEEHSISAPDLVQDRYVTLQSMWFQYVDALDHFSDSREENTKFYRRELENNWKALQVIKFLNFICDLFTSLN